MKFTDILNEASQNDFKAPAPDCDFSAFKTVALSRRSVRVYDSTPVPEAVMKNAIDIALLAPNSSNLQQAEFHWVRSAEKKQKLVEYCLGQPAAKTAQELVVVVARTDTWRRNAEEMVTTLRKQNAPKGALSYYEKLVPMAYTQGLLGPLKKIGIAVAGMFKVIPREPTSYMDMRVWASKSAALACQNFMLAIRAQNFDTCPMEGHDALRVRKLLGLPCGAYICMVISVGKRAPGGVYGPQVRFARERFVFEH